MSNMYTSKYISRNDAVKLIQDHLETASRTPIEQSDNAGYQLGHALGYTDGLSYALRVLREMPEEQKPEPPKLWHHSR